MKKWFIFFVCMAATLSLTNSSSALDFDFSGTFQRDNDIVLLDFTVGQDSMITIFSSSWDDGGFDPILSIWDSNGNLMQQQDDGGVTGSTVSNGVAYDHDGWDSYFQLDLAAGNYTASIGQFNNFSNSTLLSDGFEHDNNPNFTYDLGYGSQEYFNGIWYDNDFRNGNWAFHILNVEEATATQVPAVPEPGTIMLLGGGLLGLLGFGRKKLKK